MTNREMTAQRQHRSPKTPMPVALASWRTHHDLLGARLETNTDTDYLVRLAECEAATTRPFRARGGDVFRREDCGGYDGNDILQSSTVPV